MGVRRTKPPENKYLLDEISEESVTRGIEGDNRICALHFKLFYCLEAQRVRHYEELIEAIRSSVSKDPFQISGWSRAVTVKWTNNPLSAAGSLTHIGGRFNYGRQINEYQFRAFPALYIGNSHEVALAERVPPSAHPSPLSDNELALAKQSSYSYFVLKGTVHKVLDITKAKSLRKVSEIMSTFEKDDAIDELAKLAGKKPIPLVRQPGQLKQLLHDPDWRGAPTQINLPSAPQIFGKIVRDAGVEGILYNSSKARGGKCLAIFPENLEDSASSIALADEPPNSIENTILDKDTWQNLI